MGDELVEGVVARVKQFVDDMGDLSASLNGDIDSAFGKLAPEELKKGFEAFEAFVSAADDTMIASTRSSMASLAKSSMLLAQSRRL